MGFSNPTGGQVTIPSNVNATITNPSTAPVPVTIENTTTLSVVNTSDEAATSISTGKSDNLAGGNTQIIPGVAGKRIYVASVVLCVTPDAAVANTLEISSNGQDMINLRWAAGATPYPLAVNPRFLCAAGAALVIACTVGGKSDFTYAVTYVYI